MINKKIAKRPIILISLLFLSVILVLSGCAIPKPKPVTEITYPQISKMTDDEFLDEVEGRAFLFFWNEANPETGLVKDRADNFKFNDNKKLASVASVGFCLPAICIAESRGWVGKRAAYERILNTLKFFRDKMVNNHGFYYHFVHMDSGEQLPQSEGSSIDTALFLAGALFAGKYFEGTEVEEIAQELYNRVDWQWMLAKGTTLSMGWNRHGNFLMPRWNQYNEGILCYILAIGSPTHPIPASSWDEITRQIRTYKDYTCITHSALFTHQYPQFWVDLRNKHDKFVNYFWNSTQATLANRQFCIDNMNKYKTYGPNSWGLTACDGPGGYKVYGALPAIQTAVQDGTVAPTAAGGSMMFTPDKSLSALKFMYHEYKDKIWGKYGFCDAYNIDRSWHASDVIGIDQGALILGIENARTGMVWDYFMKNECIQRALDKIGFKSGAKKLKPQIKPMLEARKINSEVKIDGDLSEWINAQVIHLLPSKNLEFGNLTNYKVDLLADCMFMWDDENLYAAFKVTDNQILTPYVDSMIYRNDGVELFVDPENNHLIWGNPFDFQIGLSPDGSDGKRQSWAWFQNTKGSDVIDLSSVKTKNGYIIEASIKWKFLNVEPKAGLVIGISPAVHDMDDKDGSPNAKLNWYFVHQQGGCLLGELKLISNEK